MKVLKRLLGYPQKEFPPPTEVRAAIEQNQRSATRLHSLLEERALERCGPHLVEPTQTRAAGQGG